MMGLLWWVMVTCLAVKVAVQPDFVSWLMDSKEPVMLGNKWTVQASGGRPGMVSCPRCELFMVLPLGTSTVRLWWNGVMLVQGPWTLK